MVRGFARRRLLAAAAGGLLAPGEQVVRLGLGPGQRSQSGAAAQAFAASVAQLTAGRYAVEIFGLETLGDEAELIEAVRLGALKLALVSVLTLAETAPALGVFAIPFLFRDLAQARSAVDGPAGMACLESARAAGLAGIGWSEDGLRHITTARDPVRRPADLRGLRLPVPAADAEVLGFRSLGANVSVLPAPAARAALQAGRMDAQEGPIAAVLAGELWRVQRCLSLTAHVYLPAVLIAASGFWSALPDADRDAFREAAQAAAQAARGFNDEADRAGLDRLRELGMTVVEDVDRDAFAAALDPEAAPFVRLFGAARIAALRAAV
jgi:tripartite ATP-independent transporter DctP family solute receptor